jgi:hypothetical protein
MNFLDYGLFLIMQEDTRKKFTALNAMLGFFSRQKKFTEHSSITSGSGSKNIM